MEKGSAPPNVAETPALAPEEREAKLNAAERAKRDAEREIKRLTGGDDDDDDLATRAPLVADLLPDVVAQLLRRSEGKEKAVPVPWSEVTAALGGEGLWPGSHVLVGGTGTGKSQWALQLALHAAQKGCPVLYIGLELRRLDLIARLAALVEGPRGPHWSKLYRGTADNTAEVLTRASSALRELPIRLEFGGAYGWHYDNLKTRVAALVKEHESLVRDDKGNAIRPPLVVLDFLQLVASPNDGRREDTRERIQKTAYAARMVAEEYGAAVLMVSGTARDNYAALTVRGKVNPSPGNVGLTRNGLKYGAADLVGMGKESGEIEYSADSVLVLAKEQPRRVTSRRLAGLLRNVTGDTGGEISNGKPKPKQGEDPNKGASRFWPVGGASVHFVAAKLRAGVTGHAELRFNGTRFAPTPPAPATFDAKGAKAWDTNTGESRSIGATMAAQDSETEAAWRAFSHFPHEAAEHVGSQLDLPDDGDGWAEVPE